MKFFVWIGFGVVALGLALGKLMHGQKPPVIVAITQQTSAPVQDIKQDPDRNNALDIILTSSASTTTTSPLEKSSRSAANYGSAFAPTAKARTPSDIMDSSEETNHSNDLDSELIDQIVAAPFNQIVKEQLVGEGDKDRFKKFALADIKDEWSLTMENHLYDGVISHPLANLITIQSISCKAGICELQIYEQNNNVWSQVITDLGSQPWWDFQSFSTYTFVAMVDLRRRNASYVLLGKTQ